MTSYADYNTRFARAEGFRAGLPTGPLKGLSPSSPTYYHAVKVFQAENGLKADGYFGPKTLERYADVHGEPVPGDVALWCGMQLPAPCGVEWRNWQHEEGFPRAAHRERWDQPVDTVIIHESVTRSAEDTVAVLSRERTTKSGSTYRCGVHLMIGPDGVVYQMADIADDRTVHTGGGYNAGTIAIEIVNPYKPEHLEGHELPWEDVIEDAPWASGDAYVVPTLEQCEALVAVLRWLSVTRCGRVKIGDVTERATWPAAAEKSFALWRVPGGPAGDLTGVVAHHHAIDHSDGAFPALVAYLVLVKGMDTASARTLAMERAQGAKRSVEV